MVLEYISEPQYVLIHLEKVNFGSSMPLIRQKIPKYWTSTPPVHHTNSYYWTSMPPILHSNSHHWTLTHPIHQCNSFFGTSMLPISEYSSYYWTSVLISSQSGKLLYVLKLPTGLLFLKSNQFGNLRTFPFSKSPYFLIVNNFFKNGSPGQTTMLTRCQRNSL